MKLKMVSSKKFSGIPFGNLKDEQKLEVRTTQRLSQKWRNERDLGKIYMTSCSKEAQFNAGNLKPQPCFQCNELLKDSTFKWLVSLPVPTPKNAKFMPKIWHETKDEVHLLEKYGSLGLKPIIRAYKNVSCSFLTWYQLLRFFLFCFVYLCLFIIFRSESWRCRFDSLLFDSYRCHTIDS